MPEEILSLGLPQETINAISNYLRAEIHVASTLDDVEYMLESHDVGCIVVNVAMCPNPLENVTNLLGHTPLTTRIVLLNDNGTILDLGKLSSMGIKTLSAPYAVDELVDEICH